LFGSTVARLCLLSGIDAVPPQLHASCVSMKKFSFCFGVTCQVSRAKVESYTPARTLTVVGRSTHGVQSTTTREALAVSAPRSGSCSSNTPAYFRENPHVRMAP